MSEPPCLRRRAWWGKWSGHITPRVGNVLYRAGRLHQELEGR